MVCVHAEGQMRPMLFNGTAGDDDTIKSISEGTGHVFECHACEVDRFPGSNTVHACAFLFRFKNLARALTVSGSSTYFFRSLTVISDNEASVNSAL